MKEFSVLCWNVQGVGSKRSVLPFKRAVPVLTSQNSDIICLQEMTDANEKLLNTPELNHYYKFIPKNNSLSHDHTPGFNHNVLLSKHPILNASELIFPQFSSKNLPIENAIRAEIEIHGKIVRFYVCHFVIKKMGLLTRLKQIEYILADAIEWQGPIIICGDMNVAMPKNQIARKIVKWWHSWPNEEMHLGAEHKKLSEKEIFHRKISDHGFTESLDLNQATWSPLRIGLEMFKLKLDWFLVKNLQTVKASVGGYVSDHRLINVTCQLPEK
ncbi:MAG: endonuclease/exonuclease/phosphatase family protein [Candidatus Doudnabacteria bacterium]|nr:endonuclease/exonuclease/phosphatase family protein [Candidatus Doudnabacteria bacterium]